MACVILSLNRNKFSKEYTNFVKAMTREEAAWVHYWSSIYYDLVSAHEAAPWETLEFVNCVLKGALFQHNDATMKAIEILRYFGVQRTAVDRLRASTLPWRTSKATCNQLIAG